MKIELLKPHTHAGQDYPAGSIIELDLTAARWLISIGSAKAIKAIKQHEGNDK